MISADVPWIVFPVIGLLLFAMPLLLVPSVSSVDARAKHRNQEDSSNGQGDESRKGHARALETVRPYWLADLLAPGLCVEERERRGSLAVGTGQLLVVEARPDKQLARVEARRGRHCVELKGVQRRTMRKQVQVRVAYRICGELVVGAKKRRIQKRTAR